MNRVNTFVKAMIVILLIGCGSANYFPERKILKKNELEARDPKNNCFIELYDGKIMKYGELDWKSKIGSGGNLIGDGKVIEFKNSEMKSFQTTKFYAYALNQTSNSQVDNEPLFNNFVVRANDGKIEVFVTSVLWRKVNTKRDGEVLYSTGNEERVYYLRKGKTSQIVGFSKEALRGMVSDNKNLKDKVYFNELFKSKFTYKSILNVIEEYN